MTTITSPMPMMLHRPVAARTSALRTALPVLTGALVLAALLGATMLGTVTPAAAEDDDMPFEQKIIRNLLGGGERPDIDYRERSPLVIPPKPDLPPPDTGPEKHSAAWPHDPDAVRPGKSSSRRMSADEGERESARPLRPDEMRRGTTRRGARSDEPVRTLSDGETGRPLRPSEMGDSRSLFNMFGSNEPATTAFKEEPERSKLTEPPSGYRTPSPSQPYAPPKDTGSWFKSFNIWDRGTETH